ncbi:subunit of the stator stalk of mitochondrial F1F0 ATP synthase [Salix suchowensis]|nr:subunit of the stator stalk of mitochondrial F1F0 ATP synthase [Salix suchowensis]
MGHGEDHGQGYSTSHLKTETRATQKLRERSYAICVLLSGRNEGRIEVEETYSYFVIDTFVMEEILIPTTVELTRYRSILKNTAIVDEAEKLLKDFKPVTYDVSAHVKAIETFEAKAVSRRVRVEKAKETEAKIDIELKELQATLANIEEARPFEDLTVEDVGAAHPRIVEAVETMMKKGKWTVPGYKEKFGDLNMM